MITTEQITATYDRGEPLHFKAEGVISSEAMAWTHDSLLDKVVAPSLARAAESHWPSGGRRNYVDRCPYTACDREIWRFVQGTR